MFGTSKYSSAIFVSEAQICSVQRRNGSPTGQFNGREMQKVNILKDRSLHWQRLLSSVTVLAGYKLPIVHKKCTSQAGCTSPSCVSFPGPAWPRRQMLRIILDFVLVTVLGVLFRDVSKVLKMRSQNSRNPRWNPQNRGLKGSLASRPPREEPERERGLSSLGQLLHALSVFKHYWLLLSVSEIIG